MAKGLENCMNSRVDVLLHEAKQLTEDEREVLIAALQATLKPAEAEWEAQWMRECEDRIDAVDRGEMETRDAGQVIEELRAMLRAR